MRKSIFLFGFALALLFTNCEKDEEEKAPYVGLWETEVYDAIDPLQQVSIKQQMQFTFEEESFEAHVLNGASASELVLALGIRGSIVDVGGNTIEAELNEVGLNATGTLTWYSKDNAAEKPLFDQYIGLVSAAIPQSFDAEYTVEGNTLQLYIPAVSDTINLVAR